MKAAILTIGDEILIGQIIDTNSAWIASRLTDLGIDVVQTLSIADEENAIYQAVNNLLQTVELIITTGGLGPTSDDKTKYALCNLFGGRLILHEESLHQISLIFSKRGLPLTETNKNQAVVPSSCTPIVNLYGTAPGMVFHQNNSMLISLPGVPFEMKEMFNNDVVPILAHLEGRREVVRYSINTFGIAESFLSDMLTDFERAMPSNVRLAYLPGPSGIKLRLTAFGNSRESLHQQIDNLSVILNEMLNPYIFGYNDDTLPIVVSRLLRERNKKIAVAESCTGGYISHLITQIPGSSDLFIGGVVAYDNSIKTGVLGVNSDVIATHGAVSSQTVSQMLDGVLRVFACDYAIAVSGIAGPSGGTTDKPVGTTWIGVASNKNQRIEHFTLGNLRDINIQRAAFTALNELRKLIHSE